MSTIWRPQGEELAASAFERLEDSGAPARFDHVVVGAGVTGLTTALLLAQAGGRVAVLEARVPGAVTTGKTTGKLSLLQGTRVSTIAARHGRDVAADYVSANRAGMAWLLGFCTEHGVQVEHRRAVTFARSASAAPKVIAEHEACRSAGLPTELGPTEHLPGHTGVSTSLDDQAQIDPLELTAAMVRRLRELGGRLFAGARVRTVRTENGLRRVETDAGTVFASTLTLATGAPILDRGLYFARLRAQRSYIGAFRIPGEPPEEMYISADEPSVSLRTVADPQRSGSRLLLVGGFGHEVGRADSERHHVDELTSWAQEHFPGAEPLTTWSAQDYRTIDDLPYVGPLSPGRDGDSPAPIQTATGYAKWGLTNGAAAGLAIAGAFLDDPPSWAGTLRPWRRSEVGALGEAIKANAQVARHLATGYAQQVACPAASRVVRAAAGRASAQGSPRSAIPLCTHLYGVLNWNDAEQTWDCPLHGSRFSPDGDVLEGPATRPLFTTSNT